MLSINMRVFKTVLIIAFLGASVRCLPVTDSKPTEAKIESQTESKIESQTESKIESQTETKIESQTEPKLEITSIVPQETAATTAAPTSTYSDAIDYYDQRQNGSENFRVHVDGFAVVVAPIEALILAGAASGVTDSQNLLSSLGIQPESSTQSIGEPDKFVVDIIPNKTEPAISKTTQKQPAVRLANLLAPLIRNIRHMRGIRVH